MKISSNVRYLILSFLGAIACLGQQIDYNTQIKNSPGFTARLSTAASNNASALTTALTTWRAVNIPPGTYKLGSAITMSQSNRIICAGDNSTILQFTGSTDGLIFPDGSIGDGFALENCTIQTTNASAGKALKATSGTGHAMFSHILINNSGSGAWAYGIWTSDLESSAFYSVRCFGINICAHHENSSNALAYYGLLIGGSYSIGFETSGVEDGSIFGGTIQGGASTELVNTDGGLKFYGVHLENHGTVPFIRNTGPLIVEGVEISGSGSDIIYSSGVQATNIGHLTGSVSATGNIIRIDGGSFAPGGSIHDSTVINNTTTGHAISLGTNSTGVIAFNITSNKLSGGSSTSAIVIKNQESVVIENNYIAAGTYGIDDSAGSSTISKNKNTYNVADVAHTCNGCLAANLLNNGTEWLHGGGSIPVVITSTTYNNPGSTTPKFIEFQTNGLERWKCAVTDGTGEPGSNVGSDFSCSRYADDGTLINIPFKITRSNGFATFLNGIIVGSGSLANLGLATCPVNTGLTCLKVDVNGSTKYFAPDH